MSILQGGWYHEVYSEHVNREWQKLQNIWRKSKLIKMEQPCSRRNMRACAAMDCSPPASSVPGTTQARALEWLPFRPPRALPDPGTEPISSVSCIGRQILFHWATWEALFVFFFNFMGTISGKHSWFVLLIFLPNKIGNLCLADRSFQSPGFTAFCAPCSFPQMPLAVLCYPVFTIWRIFKVFTDLHRLR